MALFADLTRPDEEWAFIPIVSDLEGSDLPEALLATIAQDGVLVYHQPGVPLPPALAQIRPYAEWPLRSSACWIAPSQSPRVCGVPRRPQRSAEGELR
jgi:hypothetical protein